MLCEARSRESAGPDGGYAGPAAQDLHRTGELRGPENAGPARAWVLEFQDERSSLLFSPQYCAAHLRFHSRQRRVPIFGRTFVPAPVHTRNRPQNEFIGD